MVSKAKFSRTGSLHFSLRQLCFGRFRKQSKYWCLEHAVWYTAEDLYPTWRVAQIKRLAHIWYRSRRTKQDAGGVYLGWLIIRQYEFISALFSVLRLDGRN